MKENTKIIIFGILALICFIVGIGGGLYIFIYLGIICPIMTIATAINTETLTASLILWEAIWFFFKEFFAVVWILLFLAFARAFLKLT